MAKDSAPAEPDAGGARGPVSGGRALVARPLAIDSRGQIRPGRDDPSVWHCQTVTSLDDPRRVGRHEDEHLRQFVRARDRRDEPAMRRAWEDVVIGFHDRLDGLVATQHRGRLNVAEHDDAVALALEKFALNLLWTFRGTSMGELVNATKVLVFQACVDVQRRSQREHAHAAVSLDEVREDPEGGRAAANWAEAERAEHERVREEERREARDFVHWGIAQLDDRKGRVVELTRQGVPLGEIMVQLGESRDNIYALRSRGFKKLRELRARYDA